MTILATAASGRIYINEQPVVFDDLDDLEAWGIRLHNEIVDARKTETAAPTIACPDERCRILAHPDHARGHVYVGGTWPDRGDRLEARIGSGP